MEVYTFLVDPFGAANTWTREEAKKTLVKPNSTSAPICTSLITLGRLFSSLSLYASLFPSLSFFYIRQQPRLTTCRCFCPANIDLPNTQARQILFISYFHSFCYAPQKGAWYLSGNKSSEPKRLPVRKIKGFQKSMWEIRIEGGRERDRREELEDDEETEDTKWCYRFDPFFLPFILSAQRRVRGNSFRGASLCLTMVKLREIKGRWVCESVLKEKRTFEKRDKEQKAPKGPPLVRVIVPVIKLERYDWVINGPWWIESRIRSACERIREIWLCRG